MGPNEGNLVGRLVTGAPVGDKLVTTMLGMESTIVLLDEAPAALQRIAVHEAWNTELNNIPDTLVRSKLDSTP